LPAIPYKKQIRNLHALGLAAQAGYIANKRAPTPLLARAAAHGTPGVVKALLNGGAQVNARDSYGRTALHYASAVESCISNKITRLLMAAGADVDVKDKEGYTPLMRARGLKNIRAITNRHPKMSIQQETETVLKPLLGQPISDMWRAGFQVFEIGVQKPCKNRKGQDITRADRSLHVFCDWKVVFNNSIVFGSHDLRPWPDEHNDAHANPFYNILGEPELTIMAIRADNRGNLWFQTTGGYTLHIETDPQDTIWEPDDDTEQWRYLPADRDAHHFVITARGIQRY
jgi:Ankyrin repeats (3 copies)